MEWKRYSFGYMTWRCGCGPARTHDVYALVYRVCWGDGGWRWYYRVWDRTGAGTDAEARSLAEQALAAMTG